MTMWIAIEHAPKDRPVDVWVPQLGRLPDAVWRSSDGIREPEWCISDGYDQWIGTQDGWGLEPSHYMLIPEGPNGNE